MSIDQRLADLDAELTHLNDARSALIDTSTPTSKAESRRARRLPLKRTYGVAPAGKLTALLPGSDGMRTKELAQATDGDPRQVLALLKEQEGRRPGPSQRDCDPRIRAGVGALEREKQQTPSCVRLPVRAA